MACWTLRQMGEFALADKGLSELLECSEMVTWRGGCSVSHHSAASLARWLLENPDRNF